MSSSTSAEKKITLRSSDGEAFEVEEKVATESQTIKHMIEDDYSDIPLPNVTSKVLTLVIEYCKKHVEAADPAVSHETSYSSWPTKTDDALTAWDAKFVNLDPNTLFDLIVAANYLNIKGLLDLTCKTVADLMRGKTSQEICDMFHIKNDYTPEEEEEVRRNNQWATFVMNIMLMQ